MTKFTSRPLVERFWGRVQKTRTCWLWTGRKSRKGYGLIRAPDGKTVRVHRVAYELQCGPIPAGLLVCHHCDVPACVRPDHLFLGTYSDNNNDRACKGRGNHPRGKRHHNYGKPFPRGASVIVRGEQVASSKLTEDEVRKIRAMYQPRRFGIVRLSRLFSVHRATIARILRREIWAHVV